ncbi:site-2 protease family protein [Egicoccus halophilus]|uniref:site-2 protease family protein n=1 Tax=Egicoccus halophilus TaxID=1670830 RepID=UPI0016642147|nr:site-2 protease family protein [Egicoccus halophilus]
MRLTRIRGVDVRLDVSLLPFAALVAWFFADRFQLGHAWPTALTMAAVGCVLFFASILAHELGHALEARHRGLDVQRITLFLFGGVTEMHATSDSPRDEFVVAAVGPWISLVCGALFGLVSTFATWTLPAGTAAPVSEVAGLLAWVNIVLAVFNLVPGAPLDGGRVLRAGLWWLLDDRRRALRIAARCGQVLAAGLVLLGVRAVQVAGLDGLFGGLLWLAVGLFLWSAARAELRQSAIDALLEGRRARDLIGALPRAVALDQPLDVFDPQEAADGRSLVPVVGDDGALAGVVAVRELDDLHPTDRAARSARDLLQHVDHLPRVGLDDDVRELIAAFSGSSDAVRVHDGGADLAVVTEREVARALTALRRTGRTATATTRAAS